MRILNCIRNGLQILGWSTFFLWSGCTTDLPRPDVTFEDDPSEEWSKLVAQISTDQGIDWATLEANRQVLDRYVAWTGTVGPQTNRRNHTPFPKRGRTNRRFVHFINAYNAWILYGYLEQRKPAALDYMTDSNGFPPKTRAYIDGEYTTFAHVKFERLLADFQEPRIHIMLHELYTDSPSLHFWDYDTWKTRSDKAMRAFIQNGGIRQTESGWLFHPMFIDYEQDFVDWSLHDSVCDYLVDYTNSELKHWLMSQENCELKSFTINNSVPQPNPIQPLDTPEENSP